MNNTKRKIHKLSGYREKESVINYAIKQIIGVSAGGT